MNAEHDLLIRDGAVVDVSGRRRVLEHHDVAVDGECISAVGPAGSLGSASRVIQAAGRAVLPGLVNCHRHAARRDHLGCYAWRETPCLTPNALWR